MITAAIIVGGAALGSAYMQSQATKGAASTAARGADAATQAQLQMYYQGREDLAPWTQAGGWAVNNLANLIAAGPGAQVYPSAYGFVPGQTTQPSAAATQTSGGWTLPPGAIQQGNMWGFPTQQSPGMMYQENEQVPSGAFQQGDQPGYGGGGPTEWYPIGTYPEGYSGPRANLSSPIDNAAISGTPTNQLGSTPYNINEWAGRYQESPYYNFLMEEGVQARDRGAAARGMLQSGAEQKALTAYGQGLASTDYQNWLNQWYQSLTPWQSLAGLGQTSAGQTAALGAQTGANVAQTTMAGAQAQAAGQLGQGNIWGNMFNQLGNVGAMGAMGYGGGYQNPYMNQLNQNRAALNAQTGGQYAYGL